MIAYKKLLCLLLMATGTLFASAQDVTGRVLKSEDNTPVQFGNVVLYTLPDTNFVSGVVTYMEGEFTLENLKSGDYLIKVSYLGYEGAQVSFNVNDASGNLKLDDIKLDQTTQQIAEATVSADMIRGKELVDRTVYDIPPEIEKSSTTGYDLLKKIPSVNVDFNNNISIAGKRNFVLEVDGKQRDPEFLNRIMPEDIESIEIINNPSGRYDGTVDAVLNIKLKPEARVGIGGNVGIMAKPFGKPTAAINGGIDYGLEKITFYVSGFSFLQHLDNTSTTENLFLYNSLDSLINQTGHGDFDINASSINTGFDYYINKKNSLSVNYNIKPNSMLNNLEYNGLISQGNTNTYRNGSETKTDGNSRESNVSIYYKYDFDEPIREFTVENNIYWFNSQDDNSFTNSLYSPDGEIISTVRRNELADNNRRYLSSKLNYVHPVGMSLRLEGGAQFYYQDIDYQFENTETSQLNNAYVYNELRNAVYAGMTFNKKKIGLQLTFRAEQSNVEINDTASDGYLTFLPSFNFQYKFNSNNNIKLTYNRRISRPDIYKLNPNIRYSSSNTFSIGNPGLEPELRDRVQLTYMLNFGKSFIQPQLYYEYLSDKVDNLNFIGESPLTGAPAIISQPRNIVTGYEYGLGLTGFVKFVYLDARIYSGHFNDYKDANSSIEAQDYTSYSITNYYTAPLFEQKLNLFAFLNYGGISTQSQTKIYNPFIYGLGGNMKIKENHTLGLVYILPFSKELQFNKTVTETEMLQATTVNSFNTEYFIQVQYHFKFNKGKAVKKIGKKINVESDTKGGGIGQ